MSERGHLFLIKNDQISIYPSFKKPTKGKSFWAKRFTISKMIMVMVSLRKAHLSSKDVLFAYGYTPRKS